MIPVKGRVSAVWDAATAAQVTERLQAIERALSGARPNYVAPAVPKFGSGSGSTPPSGSGGTGPVTSGGGGVTDHGLLSGLADNDHPQYILREEESEVIPHIHGGDDILGLESRFIARGEQVAPEPHLHVAAEVADLPQDEGDQPHAHRLADVADFSLAEMMLWQEVYGG